MSKKHSRHNALLALISGLLVFLAFERFNIVPLIFFFAIPLNSLAFNCRNLKSAFGWGFFMSFIVMLGGFYWVTYVLHEFGYMPWWVAGLLFLGFCGFGALNFPLFTMALNYLSRKIDWEKLPDWKIGLWFSLGFPALFTAIEFYIPKLFPWYSGHALYKQLPLIQICEITGSAFLTFMVYSAGSTLGLLLYSPIKLKRKAWEILLIPILLLSITLGFGEYVLNLEKTSDKAVRDLHIAVVQANIGSLEKMESEKSGGSLIDQVIHRYEVLTDEAVKATPKPELILWPETAMPFAMNYNLKRSEQLKQLINRWNVPLLTGAYAQSTRDYNKDLNAAFLLNPDGKGEVKMQSYMKNILLAFGEYLPLGSLWPKLYHYFPQIADFERGTEQNPVFLKDGTPMGVTICYEAIVPAFYKKTASHPILGVINLTNDSWFGPTSEPYLHGSLTIFRAVESRLPMVRATNTGLSFSVDVMGRQSTTTEVFKPGILPVTLSLPATSPHTFYMEYGDWFILACIASLVSLFALSQRKSNASFSH